MNAEDAYAETVGRQPDWHLTVPDAVQQMLAPEVFWCFQDAMVATHCRIDSFRRPEQSVVMMEGWYHPDADRADAAQAIRPLVEAIDRYRRGR